MARRPAGPAATWLATLRTRGEERFEVSSDRESMHSVATGGDVTVLFDGLLHTRRDWLRDFSLATESDASLVLHAYRRWGEAVVDRIKGLFALIIWDRGKDLLLCVRDPHGLYPFFYADDEGDLYLSPSANTLAEHPRISGAVDRVAIANHLCHRWPRLESTYFERVRRLPGGYVLRSHDRHRTVSRYWDPIPPGRPIEYVSEDEARHFPELLDQAVDRCLPDGRAAIYLSGGLDSVSIAALAQEEIRDHRSAASLLALSLVFEHPDANEESTQRAVAEKLGLSQEIVTVAEAVGPDGLLADALEMSASRSAPMMNLWNPAYASLGRRARQHGCEVILTGNGGDEWLEAGTHKARVALEKLDFVTVYRLWAAMQRSYPYSRSTVARNVLWTYGLRLTLGDLARRTLDRAAPATLDRRDARRFAETTPAWIAPDPELRNQMLLTYRAHKRTARRGALDNPMVAYDLEEFHESGRDLGIPLRHPFWDADLTAFLMRVPPRLLVQGGYSKGFVRQSLARRFPQLGFDRSRKVTASGFYRSVLIHEGVDAWRRMGGAQALAEIGAVDASELERHMQYLFRQGDDATSGADPGKAWQIWYVLSTEAWLRDRLA